MKSKSDTENKAGGGCSSRALLGIRYRVHHPHHTDDLYYVDKGGSSNQSMIGVKDKALRVAMPDVPKIVERITLARTPCERAGKIEIQICTLPSWRLKKRIWILPNAEPIRGSERNENHER